MNTSETITTAQNQSLENSSSRPPWKVKLLYDGDCPLCLKEVNFLVKRDAGRNLINFVDIADLDYDPQQHGGVDFATAMGRIHAVFPDNTVIEGVEVFRQVYEALGMGWIYAITKLPIFGAIADNIYNTWADTRLRITGRPDLATIIELRQQQLQGQSAGRCRLDDRKGC